MSTAWRRFLGSGGGRLCPAGNRLHLGGLNIDRRMVRAGPRLEKKVHIARKRPEQAPTACRLGCGRKGGFLVVEFPVRLEADVSDGHPYVDIIKPIHLVYAVDE